MERLVAAAERSSSNSRVDQLEAELANERRERLVLSQALGDLRREVTSKLDTNAELLKQLLNRMPPRA